MSSTYIVCATLALCCIIFCVTILVLIREKLSYYCSLDPIAERIREIRLTKELSSVTKEKLIKLALKEVENDEKLS